MGREMTVFALTKNEAAQANSSGSVEDLLVAMCKYGKPAVSRMDKGWWVRCEMHVAAEGTTFRIESDIVPSLLTAAQQCMDRIVKTISQYKEQ